MITQAEAYKIAMGEARSFGVETIPLARASGRYLAEPITADRDLPPYDRATMDGIAISYEDLSAGTRRFICMGMAAAGSPTQHLRQGGHCLEIATGAVIPSGADTVVPYEDVLRDGEIFRIQASVRKGQNIHPQGSDTRLGSILLKPGTRIGAAEVAILASVGHGNVPVYGLPRITVFSSGDELVPVEQVPLAHQVRSSNVHALEAALSSLGIWPDCRHLPDEPGQIREALAAALKMSDAILLSGGVSRGRYDHIPEVLDALGVTKLFHRVAQRPGKPFWFGIDANAQCLVFSFPGNPVSTFLNYHLYFRDWLFRGWGLNPPRIDALLAEPLSNPSQLTFFSLVQLKEKDGFIQAIPVSINSSGDFLSLSRADGFTSVPPASTDLKAGALISVIPYNPLW